MDKKQFTIKIENLVPTLVDIDAKIPCDNDGYSINFAFDDDWGNYRVKTGIFVCGGATHTSVFEGNICKVPRIKDGTKCYIGVVTGEINEENAIPDKKTSIWCEVEAIPTITSIANEPSAPNPDVYVEFMALLNKYITEGGGGGLSEEQVKQIVKTETANKVDKIEPPEYGREYAYSTQFSMTEDETDLEQHHKLIPVDIGCVAGTIAKRSSGGRLAVGTPEDPLDAVNLKYLKDNTMPSVESLDKGMSGGGTLVYRVWGSNEYRKIEASQTIEGNGIVIRSNNHIIVPEDPTYNSYLQPSVATSKAYVDKVTAPIADNTKRIENLESTLLEFIEDTESAYEKTVPVGVGKNAVLSSIGGVTKTSKNLLDPRLFGCPVNEDGSFHLEEDYGEGSAGWFATAKITLEPNVYYLSYKVANSVGGGLITNGGFLDGNGNITKYIDLNDPTTCEIAIENEGAGVCSHDIYVMLSTDPDAEFEPYFEGEKYGKVTAIESYGSNLFDYTQVNAVTEGQIVQIPTGLRVTGYNRKSTLTPEQFLAMTGLKEGDTFTYSAMKTLISGQLNGDSGMITFYGKNGNAAFGFGANNKEGYISVTKTIPTPFNNNSHNNANVFSWDNSTIDITEITITKGEVAAPYQPYSAEPIDTFTIPQQIQATNGYGKEGFVLDLDGKTTEYEGKTTDVSQYLTGYNNFKMVAVQGGGKVRFVSAEKLPVPSEITHVKAKE